MGAVVWGGGGEKLAGSVRLAGIRPPRVECRLEVASRVAF